MDMNATYIEMIAAGGSAKSLVYEALDAAIAGDQQQVDSCLAEADRYLEMAHRAQSRVLQVWAASLAGGEAASEGSAPAPEQADLTGPLLMHAQDLIMTAMSERALAERIITLARRIR